MWIRAVPALLLLGCGQTLRPAQVLVLVSDSSTGLAVSGATVSLARNGRSLVEVETDPKGRAAFSGLLPGNYLLRAEKPGYIDLLDPGGRGRPLPVAASNINMSLGLSRTATISGSVRDAEGRPLQRVKVLAVARRGVEGWRFASVGQPAHTDDMGRYRLFGLPAGHYSVAVVPGGGDNATGPFAPVFYGPGHPGQAVFFKIKPGEDRTSVDLTVPRTELSSISGTVSGIPPDATPARAAVALVTRGDLRLLMAASLTDSDGSFVMSEIPPGDYQLIAWSPFKGWEASPWQSLKSTVRTTAHATVVAGGDAQISLELQPVVSVTGHLVWEGDRTSSQACSGAGEIVFESQEGWPDEWMPVVIPEDGRFHVAGLPVGRYRISMHKLRDSCPLAEVRVGDQAAPRRVALVDGSNRLTLVLTSRTGEVSGAVTAKETSPAIGIVLLAPLDADDAVQVAPIDAEGRYRFGDVLAGHYRLVALSGLESTDHLDPEEARRLGAELVFVEGEKKLTSDLKLVGD